MKKLKIDPKIFKKVKKKSREIKKAKCLDCGKTWSIVGKPRFINYDGYYCPPKTHLPDHKCKKENNDTSK